MFRQLLFQLWKAVWILISNKHYNNLEKPLIKSLSVKNFSNLIWYSFCLVTEYFFSKHAIFLTIQCRKAFWWYRYCQNIHGGRHMKKLAAAKLLLKNSRNFFCMKRISHSQNSKIPYAPKGVSLGLWEWGGIRVIQSTNTTILHTISCSSKDWTFLCTIS